MDPSPPVKFAKILRSDPSLLSHCRVLEDAHATGIQTEGDSIVGISGRTLHDSQEFVARGRRYVGDLLSDVVHPNDYGHQLLGSTLAAALGVPNQLIWEQAYFRALAAGAKAP